MLCLEFHLMLTPLPLYMNVMTATDINLELPNRPIAAWIGLGVYMKVQRKKNSCVKSFGEKWFRCSGTKMTSRTNVVTGPTRCRVPSIQRDLDLQFQHTSLLIMQPLIGRSGSHLPVMNTSLLII